VVVFLLVVVVAVLVVHLLVVQVLYLLAEVVWLLVVVPHLLVVAGVVVAFHNLVVEVLLLVEAAILLFVAPSPALLQSPQSLWLPASLPRRVLKHLRLVLLHTLLDHHHLQPPLLLLQIQARCLRRRIGVLLSLSQTSASRQPS